MRTAPAFDLPDEPAVARALARRIVAAVEREPHDRARTADGPHPARALSRARRAARGRRRFFPGHDVQSRRVPGRSSVAPGQLPQLHGDAPVSTRQHPVRAASTSSTARRRIPRRSARATRHAIAEAGGIDLQILGIGTNGHIGFNEPARELQARTHRVTLKPETRRSNAALFGGDAAAVPAEALSMGMATILHARADRPARDRAREGGVRRTDGARAR